MIISECAPHAIKIPASNNFGPFKVKNGETYQISFDIKRVTATVDFDLYAYYSITDNKINKIGYRDYTSNWSAKKAKIANFTKGTADWTHITANLTVSALKELSDLTFVLYNTAWGNVGSQEIYIDNVEVKKTTVALTVHTSASETKTITAKCDADLSTVNVPMAGARFKGLYLDAALTEPATGTVGYEPRELSGSALKALQAILKTEMLLRELYTMEAGVYYRMSALTIQAH